MATNPYTNHADAITQIDATIRNETAADSVSTDDVSDASVRTNAMLDAIVRTQADGSITYHAPADRTVPGAWWTILQGLLTTTAADGDTFTLPAVLFQPGAADNSTITITASDVTINGHGATIMRGPATPMGLDTVFVSCTESAQNLRIVNVVFDGNGAALSPASGTMVVTRARTAMVDCLFTNPNHDTDAKHSFHIRHWADVNTLDELILQNCNLIDCGHAAINMIQGNLFMLGGAIRLENNNNPSGIFDSTPEQRMFDVGVTNGYRVDTVIFEGVNFYATAGTGSGIGGYGLSGDERTDDPAGCLAAQDWTAHTGLTPTTQPNARPGNASPASPCQVTITTAATTPADIGAITVVLNGTDGLGQTKTETLRTRAGVAETLRTDGFWATITSIDIPAHAGSTATTSVGWYANRLHNVVFRDCNWRYDNYDHDQYTKFQRCDNVLYDGCTVHHENNQASPERIGRFRWQKGTESVRFTNCTGPFTFASLGATLRQLIIENCVCDFRVTPNNYFIEGAEDILEITVTDSVIRGFMAQIVNNAGTGSYWPDHDALATVLFKNVTYEFTYTDINGGAAYVLGAVPRPGYFTADNLRSMTMPDAPGQWDGPVISSSDTKRLMSTCLNGDRHTMYLGRRLDTNKKLANVGTGGTYADSHPMPVTTGGDAFPGITTAQAGDRIENCYYQSSTYPTITAIKGWTFDGSIWVAETDTAITRTQSDGTVTTYDIGGTPADAWTALQGLHNMGCSVSAVCKYAIL